MKTFYSDYATHALRFYCRNMESENKNPSWTAAKNAINAQPPPVQDLLIQIFNMRTTLDYAVQAISDISGAPTKYLYAAISKVSKLIAAERGLL